ncbi:MAG: hypothetical protein SGJ27_10310 [Candidatus Melainabacteria bacterium]|nr:hypothetical protein [Candidatus Melainabacteria bacterium]
MEKLFTPNKWFVGFCALLIAVVATLKVVGDMHLAEYASTIGEDVFAWEWPELGMSSRVTAMKGHVIRRDANDAVVEVSGHQVVSKLGPDNKIEKETVIEPDVHATLTFYKRNSKWELGKVELK